MREQVGWRVCWVLPLLRHALCAPTAEASIGVSSSRSAWLSTGASLASESADREHDATQSASFLDSSLEAIDAIPENGRAVGLVEVNDEAAVKNLLSNSKPGGYKTSAVATGVGAALALLFCLFLMGGGVHRRAALKGDGFAKKDSRLSLDATREGGTSMREGKEADESPSADPKAEAERRLEEVRKLLPSASRLASAVDSDEAQILLATVKENVDQTYQLEGKLMDNKEPSERLNCALEALRSLHRTAILHAEVLVKTGGESHVFSMLDSNKESVALLGALEKDMKAEGVLSFVEYLRLLDQSISNMCRQFGEARNELSAERKFVDERDGQLLLSLTKKVEWLRDLANKKGHALDTAIKLEKSMLYAVRTHIFGVREISLLHLEGELGIAKALAAAAAGGDKEPGNGKEAQEDPDLSQSNILSSLSENIEMAEAVLVKLRGVRLDLESVQPHISLGDILSVSKSAEELEAKASSLLLKCFTFAMDHPHLTEVSRPDIHNMLKDVALKAHWRAVSEKAGLRVALREIEAANSVLPGSPDFAANPTPHLNTLLITNLLESAKEISGKAEKYYSDAKALVEALHRVSEPKHMVSQVQKATATVSPMVKLSSQCYMLMLDNCLLKVLDTDIVFSMRLAARASSIRVNLPPSEQGVLEGLQAKFDAAKKAAKEAQTIKGAVEAAAIMRETAEAMEDLLLKQRKGLPHSH
ncbi:hypothetical protein, conserved [Eimeria praecox]|uniref:Transmembrane protein n=1 Tax=Eimeria praecox TaxID=51316 RepID=U6H3T6_9EIME|nr:hypothetical protein, conserved [Eimeria praecox]